MEVKYSFTMPLSSSCEPVNLFFFFSVRSGQIRNSESARVSMPGQLSRFDLSQRQPIRLLSRNLVHFTAYRPECVPRPKLACPTPVQELPLPVAQPPLQ